MNAIIFDCETNGKPKNYKGLMKDVNNWPRVSQLAWKMINVETEEVLSEHQYMIYPDGWTIPTVEEQIAAGEKNPYFFIENNMSTERCMEEGKPIAEVLLLLVDDMNQAEVLVAHNMNFDRNVVGAEMIRIGLFAEVKLFPICTMEIGTNVCRIPGYYGRFKWPSLMELHIFLFGVEFVGAHDAMDDVTACCNCFIEMVKRKIIKLKIAA